MYKINRETAGEDLMKFIFKKGLTQKKIAEGSGLTEITISRIISGKTPNSMTLFKLNQYLSNFE